MADYNKIDYNVGETNFPDKKPPVIDKAGLYKLVIGILILAIIGVFAFNHYNLEKKLKKSIERIDSIELKIDTLLKKTRLLEKENVNMKRNIDRQKSNQNGE
ncbi:MAG: hypothetical protein ACKVTZ_19160, partial [Bacteroidia bacterium]